MSGLDPSAKQPGKSEEQGGPSLDQNKERPATTESSESSHTPSTPRSFNTLTSHTRILLVKECPDFNMWKWTNKRDWIHSLNPLKPNILISEIPRVNHKMSKSCPGLEQMIIQLQFPAFLSQKNAACWWKVSAHGWFLWLCFPLTLKRISFPLWSWRLRMWGMPLRTLCLVFSHCCASFKSALLPSDETGTDN